MARGFTGVEAVNAGVSDPRHGALFDNANNKGNVATNVRAMQQFLYNRGYRIAVDGIRGPETNAAVLAFHKHVAPNVFNTKRTAGSSNGRTPGSGPGSGGSTPSPAAKPKPTRAPAGKAPAPAPASPYDLIDPQAYAHGAVNAEYDPQISSLLQQITQGRNQMGSNTKQIQDWFDQALQVAQDASNANAGAGQDALDAYKQAGDAATNLFGGPGANASTASEANAFHDINLGNLAANIESQGAYDKNLRAILAGQGAEAQRAQLNSDQQGLSDLAQQLVSLRGAKGQAYASALQQGIQNRTQQEAAQQQLELAKQLAPAQVAEAQANAQTAQANAGTAAANAKANLAIAQAKLKQANLQTKQALASTGGQWNLKLPQQQGALQKAFETNVFGPRGGLSLQPDVAWANLQQQLQMNGLSNDPRAQAIAKGVFLQGLHASHSLGNFGGWAWNGSKVVRTGNKYAVDKKSGKRVLINSKGKVIPDYRPKS